MGTNVSLCYMPLAAMLLTTQDPRLDPYRNQIGYLFTVSEETTHQGMITANAELNLNTQTVSVRYVQCGSKIL